MRRAAPAGCTSNTMLEAESKIYAGLDKQMISSVVQASTTASKKAKIFILSTSFAQTIQR
jgi:hypothetical protein